ncbi:MAG TPA: siderophore-interacting protein [Marmoricola sp.]
MSVRPGQSTARVLSRETLSPHLVRLVLGGDGLAGFASTGVPDEWVGLVVPGQFQSRYYTVRTWRDDALTIDVVVHDEGLVTAWAQTDCVGDEVTLSEPKGSFALPDDAAWVHLVGDLTALPAMARIAEQVTDRPVRIWAETQEVPGYFATDPTDPVDTEVTWIPAAGGSRLAALVETIEWPDGPGYFWMAGESAQMREIRRYVRRSLGWGSDRHDLMGYWSATRPRQTRAIDPGPIYARGKAAGKSDEEIWAEYDELRAGQ